MLALRFYDRRDIRLEEIPRPYAGKNEVCIRVTDAGISQTQINEFIEGPFIINRDPHPLTGKGTPIVPCQEYGGIVESVGEGVDSSLIGQQVAVLPLVSCGQCAACRDHEEQLCDKLAYHGLLGLDGGFADYSVVGANNIIPVSSRSMLTFVEPILVAIHAAQRCMRLEALKAKKVLILGAGPIGICTAAVWHDYFGADVTLNDILDTRLKRAAKAGLPVVSKEEIRDRYDIVIDAAGMDSMVDQAALTEGFGYLKKGGVLLNIGTYFHPVPLVPSTLLLSEHLLFESVTYNSHDLKLLPEVLAKIDLDYSLFVDEVPLRNIIEEGYYRAEVDKESFTRIVVRPGL